MADAPKENKDKEQKPAPGSSPENGQQPDNKGGEQDIDFDKELEALEQDGAPAPKPKPGKTPEEERQQAEFSLKSTAKRIKDLGGDPAKVLGEEASPAYAPIDTSRFVTKEDLAASEARKLSRSEGEYKVIMWYVKNKGLSVEDAHLIANKGRVKKAISEISRGREAQPSNGGAGAGEAQPTKGDEPQQFSQEDQQRLIASGMKYDPDQKAWVGSRSKLQWNGKEWVNQRVVPGKK